MRAANTAMEELTSGRGEEKGGGEGRGRVCQREPSLANRFNTTPKKVPHASTLTSCFSHTHFSHTSLYFTSSESSGTEKGSQSPRMLMRDRTHSCERRVG